MNIETVFQIINTLVLPQWLLMIFLPKWKWTEKLVNSYAIPIFIAVVYVWYIAGGLGGFEMDSFSTLANIKSLFTKDEAVLAGWAHYLVFDLLVGSWIYKTAKERGMSAFLVAPCLFFCLMFGPFGWLLFKVMSVFKK